MKNRQPVRKESRDYQRHARIRREKILEAEVLKLQIADKIAALLCRENRWEDENAPKAR